MIKSALKKTHLSESRCLQELLRGAGSKIKEIRRPQSQNPGIHFVSFLERFSDLIFRSIRLH